MEGEPELPAPLPSEAKFFRPDPTHPINIYPNSFNLSRTFNSTSSSTTSSSPSSPPDLVRHAQAAFKRHRPLVEVEECVKVLKNAAKTRKVPADEILKAFSVVEKAKLVDPSPFLETLCGKYFPITAVQRERGLRMGCISGI
ncbi:hypothetical protein CASFOL_016279 [Castilleja foliolosa]|uniref:Uncharacterized protein n=1 Tax=Castilleja foliolosa TaxID=1961234 RepID=A0ABD3DI46_9LAMI